MKNQKFRARRFHMFLFINGCLLPLLFFISCARDKSIIGSSGEWTTDIPFVVSHVGLEIPHDNRIFETDHFLVFSDESSDDIKKDYARKAERALIEVLEAFDIKNAAQIGVVGRQRKITIYTEKKSTHNQLSFPYGFLLYGEDSDAFAQWPSHMKPRFYIQIKHEMVHVVQFLLGVLPNPERREREPHRWFNEGLAEYVSGGFFIPITKKSDYETWKRSTDHINPISIHMWRDLPIPSSRVGEYYPMFGLAVKYLLDPKGLNKSLLDVKAMFSTLAENNTDFAIAFELHFGLNLEEFENSFFQRMDNYFEH